MDFDRLNPGLRAFKDTLFNVTDQELERNIGKHVRFTDPELLKFPAYQAPAYEIVGIQRMWGTDPQGRYVPDRIGYRIVAADDTYRFGMPALPESVEIIEGTANG